MKRLLASLTALSVVAVVLPTASSSSAAAPTAATPRVTPESSGRRFRTTSDVVLVDVSLGGRNDLEGATVEALDANGTVLQSIVSSNRGEAVMSRLEIRKAVKLRVTGGTSEWGTPNNATLYGPVRLDPRFITVVHVTPVTTLAEKVSQHRGIPFGKGLRAVRTHLEIPHWTAIRHHANTPSLFGPVAFGKLVDAKGGVRQALRSLEREMDRGAKHHPLSDRSRQGRGLAEFAGEFLFETVLEAALGSSAGEALGGLFGQTDPTDTALAQMEAQLEQISEQLTEIQNQIQNLTNEIKTSEYYTIKTNVDRVVNATLKQWDVYSTVVSTVTSGDYADYANDFFDAFNTASTDFGSLFTNASGPGVLDALYQMYLTQYPWWNAGDIAKIQSVIDYYGLMQAEAFTMLREAWTYSATGYTHTKTSDYINTQQTSYYQPQHNKIYAAMPDTITNTQIVNPANQRAYTLAPYTPPLGKIDDRISSNSYDCAGTHVNDKNQPQVSAATISGWWATATPAGSTSANSTELAFLKNSRSVTTNGVATTTNALGVVAPAAPNAWVAISNQAQPSSMWGLIPGVAPADYYWAGWAYCGSNSVSLVPSQIPNFATGKLMGLAKQYGGNTAFVPSGLKAAEKVPVPVGLLVYVSGNWRYKTS